MSVTLLILAFIVVSSLSLPQVTRKFEFQLAAKSGGGGNLCINVLFSLKPIDVVVLKKLSEVVNVVPVIAKSDSLTTEERDAFKQRVSFDKHVDNARS